jgi:hypothetical protein
MAKNEDKSKQYAKFVDEFVNAKTSDEIFLKLLSNIREILNFSSEFKEKARKMFPSRKSFSSLSKVEKQLLLLFIVRSKFGGIINGNINRGGVSREFLGFDYSEGWSLIIEEINPPYGDGENPGIRKVGLNDFAKLFEEVWKKDSNKSPHLSYATDILRRFINIEKTISRLKHHVSESKCSEIQELSVDYKKTFLASKFLRTRQETLKGLLNELVKGKNFSEIETLEFLLRDYNFYCKPQLGILSTGLFYNKMVALQENYFLPSEDVDGFNFLPTEDFNNYFPTEGKHYFFAPTNGNLDIPAGWLSQYQIAIIFCTVEFLRNVDLSKLKKCPVSGCERFFVGRMNQTYCSQRCKDKAHQYSPEKMRDLQRERRGSERKEKEKILKKQVEKEIQRRMKKQDLNRKEAIEQIIADREIDLDM